MPTSRPNSVSLSPSSSLMRTPMIEKIVHTAKQTVKAIVDIQSARPSLLLGVRAVASRACIHCSPYGPCGAAPDQLKATGFAAIDGRVPWAPTVGRCRSR